MLRVLGLTGAALLLLGCSPITTEVVRLAPGIAPAKATPCDLAVLADPPRDRPYEELALVSARSFQPLEKMLPRMKDEACKLGADALILKSTTMGGGRHASQASAVAIRYR